MGRVKGGVTKLRKHESEIERAKRRVYGAFNEKSRQTITSKDATGEKSYSDGYPNYKHSFESTRIQGIVKPPAVDPMTKSELEAYTKEDGFVPVLRSVDPMDPPGRLP